MLLSNIEQFGLIIGIYKVIIHNHFCLIHLCNKVVITNFLILEIFVHVSFQLTHADRF